MRHRRIRILVYECDSKDQLEEQLSRSIQGTRNVIQRNDRPALTIQAIDWDWRRITLLELWQLIRLEWQATQAQL